MELMIVIVLVSTVYALILMYIKPKKKNIPLVSTSPLKALLLPHWNHSHIYMICGYKCIRCTIYDDNNSIISSNIPFPIKNIRVKDIYMFNDSGGLAKKVFSGVLPLDEKICLRYDLYPNRSSSELFLEDKNGSVLYFPPYFDTFKRFTSLQSTRNYFEDIKLGISR